MMIRRTAQRPTKRTKIVCTIGPASAKPEVIRQLILEGADVFRLNFSHGTHEDHATVIRILRDIGHEHRAPYAILADLSGPKLRVGRIAGDAVQLHTTQRIVLTSEEADGSDLRFQVNIANFHEVAQAGETILLDDGKISLVVDAISGPNVHCQVQNDGILKSRKGVNLPDTKLPIPALTEKDERDLKFALEAGVDIVALSFVRSPRDVEQAKELIASHGRRVPLFAKIEKKEAVEHLDAIMAVADGAMVARGDLGIELPMQKVPAIQKRIIRLCNRLAKPVITATQMLESMVVSPTPTRAEVTDIFNAIQDGTDAVMLSAETASGAYPVEAVAMMDLVAGEAERAMRWNKGLDWVLEGTEASVTHVICAAAVEAAERLSLDLIVIPTVTGYSAYHVSRFKPSVPIFACSTEPGTVNALCLAWGTAARIMAPLRGDEIAMSETDALVNQAIRCAKESGFARPGQRVVVIGGLPIGQTKHTNYLRVMEIT